jgi:hypothetical protein
LNSAWLTGSTHVVSTRMKTALLAPPAIAADARLRWTDEIGKWFVRQSHGKARNDSAEFPAARPV